MKKVTVLCLVLFALVMSGCSHVQLEKTEAQDIPRSLGHSFIDTITISADGSAVALPSYWKGWYLAQVFLLASADDAFTITINQHNGGRVGTITTTAATTGEYMPSDAATAECRYITGTPTYTLSGLGSGTITLEAVLVQ